MAYVRHHDAPDASSHLPVIARLLYRRSNSRTENRTNRSGQRHGHFAMLVFVTEYLKTAKELLTD